MTRKLEETFLDVLLDEDTQPDVLPRVADDPPAPSRRSRRPTLAARLARSLPETEFEVVTASEDRDSRLDRWEERTRIVDFDTPDLIRISQRPELEPARRR